MTTATETTVRPIVVGILADHEDWAYLLHPELPVRPPTEQEAAGYVDRVAHPEDYECPWLYGAYEAPAPKPVPSPPAAPEPPQHIARPFSPPPASVSDPGPIHCDCQDDPAPVLDPVAELALQRINEQHDAQDAREATAQIPAVDAITTTVPAVTADGEPK